MSIITNIYSFTVLDDDRGSYECINVQTIVDTVNRLINFFRAVDMFRGDVFGDGGTCNGCDNHRPRTNFGYGGKRRAAAAYSS